MFFRLRIFGELVVQELSLRFECLLQGCRNTHCATPCTSPGIPPITQVLELVAKRLTYQRESDQAEVVKNIVAPKW